ncbi:MAG: DEAD/DEAH box helicase [Saprospiraceae bacterium]|nr:DEAD/DEAH box helicase [Saprospiraceae bacterium]
MEHYNDFEGLGIRPDLAEGLRGMGISVPTEIQQKAIPVLLNPDLDCIGLARTGTGKTAAFGMPVLQLAELDNRNPQALILAPTRELCMQIAGDLARYGAPLRALRIVAVYGGSSISQQIRALREGAQVVVATPGRLVDLIDRKAIRMDQLRRVVLDEADEMLNMGFRDDLERILSQTPASKSTALFSATMSSEVREIAARYLREPVEVRAGKKDDSHPDISHQYAVVHAKDKLVALKRIVDYHPGFYGIVFCNTRLETQELSDALLKDGYRVDCIHGDLDQPQRDKVMNRFRNRYVPILFATDVAARGIDVKNLTHIIHYHLPDDIENYTHRSGRTARAGQKGISIALLHVKEAYKLHRIEKSARLRFERFRIPTADEVAEMRVRRFVESVMESKKQAGDGVALPNEWVWPLMQLSKDELVRIVLAPELERLAQARRNQEDLNVDERFRDAPTPPASGKPSKKGGGGSKHAASGDIRMFVSLGKLDQMRYDELRELIFKLTSVSGRAIRDIDMFNSYSFFVTDADSARRLEGQKGLKWKKREVTFRRADAKKPGKR